MATDNLPLTLADVGKMTVEEALASFTAREQKAYEHYYAHLEGLNRHMLLETYELAIYTKKLYDEARGEKKRLYRSFLFERLGIALSISRGADYFRETMQLAVCWEKPAEFRREVVDARGPTGEQLFVTHAKQLAAVMDGDRRRALINQILAEGWSTRKLAGELSAAKGITARDGKGGPRFALPTSAGAALSNLRGMAKTWVGKTEQVWLCDDWDLREEIKKVPSETLNDDFMKTVQTTLSDVEAAVEAGMRMVSALKAVRAEISVRMEKQEEAQRTAMPEDEAADVVVPVAAQQRRNQQIESVGKKGRSRSKAK